jgi:hypothetical protein
VSTFLAALLLAALETRHAPPVRHPEVVLSEDYAPILWLAEDEPLYPMLPYAFAFDDRDNDEAPDGLIDVADAGEISGTFSNPRKKVEFNRRVRAPRAAGTRVMGAGQDSVQQGLPDMMKVVERPGADLPPPTVLYYGPAAHGKPVATVRASDEDVAGLRAGRLPDRLRDAAGKAGITLGVDAGAATLYERIGDPEREWYIGEAADGRDAIATLNDDHRLEIRIGPACRIEYWFYYLFDQGLNGHLHDSEHAFVFVEPRVRRRQHDLCKAEPGAHPSGASETPPLVRAVVGAGHEEHTANNILVASPKRPAETAADVMDARHNLVFPRGLTFHMPVLVELGKHASAPDRSFDGRFDFGMDANVFPESVWGTRDVQAGNVGRLKLGRFDNWFAFPRSERGILMPAGWLVRKEYAAAFPQQIQYLRTRDDIRTYRLVPLTDLRALHELLAGIARAARPVEAVQEFLQEHRECFWATSEQVPDPVVVDAESVTAMIATWTRTNPKRDVWTHHDHRKPDSIFKLSMFRTFSLGAVARVDAGAWSFGPALQIAQVTLPRWLPLVGGSMVFNDSTLHVQALFDRTAGQDDGETRVELTDVGVLVNSYRGRYFGWYTGADWRPSLPDGCCRLGGGLAVSVPSIPKLRAVSATARIGLFGDPFRRREPIAPVFSFAIIAVVGGVKHPLSF